MTYDFFLEYYDIKEYEILRIEIRNGILEILVSMPIHLDLIANGYRPELDMTQTKAFLFHVDAMDKQYPTDIMIHFEKERIQIGNDCLHITLSMVDIR